MYITKHVPAGELNGDVVRGLGRDDDGVAARQQEVTRVTPRDQRMVRQRLAARVLQPHLLSKR